MNPIDLAVIAVYIAGFILIGAWRSPPPDNLAWIDLRIRAFGSCAFLMLTAILDEGYQRADQAYRNSAKTWSIGVSVVLAVLGGWIVEGSSFGNQIVTTVLVTCASFLPTPKLC